MRPYLAGIACNAAIAIFATGLLVGSESAVVRSGYNPNAQKGLDERRAAGSRLYQIPFKLSRNRIVLPARAGRATSLSIILDTGMHFDGLLIYRKSLAEMIGLEDPFEVQVGGAGVGEAPRALMDDSATFFIGDVPFEGQRVIIMQDDGMEEFSGDGITGYSLFGSYVVEINYDDSIITLHDPSRFEPPDGMQWIPITFRDNMIPWIEAVVDVRGEGEIPVSLYIDLASREAIELLIRDDMKFELPDSLREHYLGRGLSGEIWGHKGSIWLLALGPYSLRGVTAAFAPANIRSKQPGADGVLANNALLRFNTIFDYSEGRLYLRPNSYFDEPFE
jgi:hypothetical protein